MMAISEEEKELLRQAAVRLLNNAWLMQAGRFPADLGVVMDMATKELERWLQDSEILTGPHREILLAFEKQFQHQIIMHFSESKDKTAFEYNGGNLLPADVDFEIDEVFDKIGDGLFGDLFAIEQAIPFASAGIVPGGTEEKITFDLERFGKQLTCIVTMYANCYRFLLTAGITGPLKWTTKRPGCKDRAFRCRRIWWIPLDGSSNTIMIKKWPGCCIFCSRTAIGYLILTSPSTPSRLRSA